MTKETFGARLLAVVATVDHLRNFFIFRAFVKKLWPKAAAIKRPTFLLKPVEIGLFSAARRLVAMACFGQRAAIDFRRARFPYFRSQTKAQSRSARRRAGLK